MDETVKLIVKIPKEDYLAFSELSEKEKVNELSYYERIIANGIPLDSVMAEIERLKHQYTDVSGYRWWNNAIDNCLHTIRDECDMREVSETMTREEAIEILKIYKEESEEDYWVMRAKALDIAIKALQEYEKYFPTPTEDCH